MAISKKEVENIAKLAKLSFSEKEIESLEKQMRQILEHVEKISELNLDGVSSTFNMSENKSSLREDRMKPWLSQDEALQNAPAKHDGYFSVPKVIKR